MRACLRYLRRVGVLRVDEGAGLGAFGVFKPAIVVNDLGAEVVVDYRDGLDSGRRRQGDAFTAMNCLGT